MTNPNGGAWDVVLSVLFFPLFFQADMLNFVWGSGDAQMWMVAGKRLLLLLPALAFLLSCWASVACLLSVIVRQGRTEFVMDLLVTWWDLGRAVIAYWGGLFKFLFTLTGALVAAVKLLVLAVWTLLHDILLVPFRLVKNVGANVLAPGVPWIAVGLTVLWALLEAAVFSYVTTPLVMDTLANMTGAELTELMVRVPLFVFLLFIVLGSYAVLSTWTETLKAKDVPGIVKIGIIEGFVMFLEVMFLYREFVDALVPWFAQHSGGQFELGLAGMLAIASAAWLGVRGVSWFLFAAHGTPTLMAVIHGSGVKAPAHDGPAAAAALSVTEGFVLQIKAEMSGLQKKGDEVLEAFVIPPLQVVAAAVNFCTLLFSGRHLFELLFTSLSQVMDSRVVLHNVGKRKALIPAARPVVKEATV